MILVSVFDEARVTGFALSSGPKRIETKAGGERECRTVDAVNGFRRRPVALPTPIHRRWEKNERRVSGSRGETNRVDEKPKSDVLAIFLMLN